MCAAQQIVFHELPMVRKIIADETWLEGERRGCPISPHDPVVCARVCEIILELGARMRDSVRHEHPELADAA